MEKHFLQAEVVALVRQSKLSKSQSVGALDAALNEVFSSPMKKACCPFCKSVFDVSETLLDYCLRTQCPSCLKGSRVVTGTIVSKRFNISSMLDSQNGLFLRFKDAANRDRYIHLYKSYVNPELKSKDGFSLCIGESADEPDSGKGNVSIMNLTLNLSPYTGQVYDRVKALEAMMGPAT